MTRWTQSKFRLAQIRTLTLQIVSVQCRARHLSLSLSAHAPKREIFSFSAISGKYQGGSSYTKCITGQAPKFWIYCGRLTLCAPSFPSFVLPFVLVMRGAACVDARRCVRCGVLRWSPGPVRVLSCIHDNTNATLQSLVKQLQEHTRRVNTTAGGARS